MSIAPNIAPPLFVDMTPGSALPAGVITPPGVAANGRKSTTVETVSPDGEGRYTQDGTCLVAYEGKSETYAVLPGCTEIAYKAFYGCRTIKRVILPDGLRAIGGMAFLNASLEEINLPASLRSIGAKAFMASKLAALQLPEGLERIEDEAFTRSLLGALRIPASVTYLGQNLFAETPLANAESAAAFSIAPESPHFQMHDGAIYATRPEGLVLHEALYVPAGPYAVREGTIAIGPRAFESCQELTFVHLPDGLREIGDNAFKYCHALTHLRVPESLRLMGAQVFNRSNLREFYLPAGFEWMDETALANTNSPGHVETFSLASIQVHPDNPHYCVRSGMLCRRLASDGTLRAILYINDNPCVRITTDIVELAPTLFLGVSGMKELHLHEGIRPYLPGTFSVRMPVPHVVFHFNEPRDGRESCEAFFPESILGQQMFVDVFEQGKCDPELLMYNADRAVFSEDDLFERYKRVLGRLHDPFMISDDFVAWYRRSILQRLTSVCQDFAAATYWEGFEQLADLGLIDAGNVERVVEAVRALGDTEATAFALEFKHRRFAAASADAFDFEL